MIRAMVGGVAACVIGSGALCAQPSANSGARIAFPESLAPLPAGARVVGNIDAENSRQMLELEISLRMKNFAAAEQQVARGGVTSSSLGDHYPAPTDYDRVVEWLKARGFEITDVDRAHRLRIGFRGTIAQAAAAFRVRFARVETNGEQTITALSPPSLPAAIGKPVLGITGLQPLRANRGPVYPHRPKHSSPDKSPTRMQP